MRIVKSGSWLYDGIVDREVDVVGLPYDYYFEMAKADGTLEADEEPLPLGEVGLIYYFRFRTAGSLEAPTWVDSPGHPTVEEAMAAAQSKAPSPIRWRSRRSAPFGALRLHAESALHGLERGRQVRERRRTSHRVVVTKPTPPHAIDLVLNQRLVREHQSAEVGYFRVVLVVRGTGSEQPHRVGGVHDLTDGHQSIVVPLRAADHGHRLPAFSRPRRAGSADHSGGSI